MFGILAGFYSLIQYKNEGENNQNNRLEQCPCCGKANPWRHGTYPRGSDRINKSSESLNPILIQRYYCPACRKTSSALPECIPPRRWYLWDMQSIALLLYLAGNTISAIESEIIPSRQTISRWIKRFQEQYRLYKDVLCGHFIELAQTNSMAAFWQNTLKIINLGEALRLCHVAGVVIP